MGNIVAIVGRPNVGKSTLFNRLTETREAIVDKISGVTRDRHYGHSEWNGRDFSIIDTGGYVASSEDIYEEEIRKQVLLAIDEADSIIFMTDVTIGITDLDKKIYHVFLNKDLDCSDLKRITDGIELEDGFIIPDVIQYVDENDKTQIGIELHSGRNRIVRRIFESLGYRINKLDRVYFAGLTKKGLKRGQWRFLTEKEINMLKMNAYE